MHLRLRAVAIAVAILTLLLANAVHAQLPPQNLPPPGAYQPIPNFSGPGAGLLFRTAINDRFSGVQQISPRLVTLAFANLPAEQNGLQVYCSDCQATIPCSGGGTGAWAFGQGGQWTCTAPNAPAPVLYQGIANASVNGLSNSGNESVSGTLTSSGLASLNGGTSTTTITASGLASLNGGTSTNSLSVSGAASLASESVNAIVGTGTAPSLSAMNVNGRVVVTAYGASGAGPDVTTGTIGAGSASLSVASASGWSAGMGIRVAHAGAATSLTAPSAPTVTNVGTTGTTTYSYEVIAIDAAHGYTAASASGSTTTGNATLSTTNFNRISWSPVSGAALYAVYQTAPGSYRVGIVSGQSIADFGSADSGSTNGLNSTLYGDLFFDIPTTAPSSAGADWLATTVSSISGTTFTLATAATTAATSQPISHDDTAAITTAFNAANATGATLYFPVGTYEFCGTSLGSSSWNNINVRGPKINAAVIDLCPGQYLFQPNAQVAGADIERLTFNGGAGVYKNIATQAMSQGYATHVFANNLVWNFTGTAFSQTGNDEPFWTVRHNSFSALDYHASIGVAMSSSTGEQVLYNNFQIARIGLKLAAAGTGVYVAGNTFIRMAPQSNPLRPRIGMWIVPGSSYESGEGFIAIGNKFGNENLANDDVPVLVADDDTTSGTDESNYLPLYVTADDLSISASGTTLTSAAECPFTSAMCQGGSGCTGSAGNWPIVIEGAGPSGTTAWNGLTTTITGFTNSCSVTVANAATTAVSGGVGRMAPSDTTNNANYLTFVGGYSATSSYPNNVFMVTTTQGVLQATLSGVRAENNTGIEYLVTLSSGTNTGYYGSGNTFVNNAGLKYASNQARGYGGVLNGNNLTFQSGTNSTGCCASVAVSPRLGSTSTGLGLQGSVVSGNGSDILDVYTSDGVNMFNVNGNSANGTTVNGALITTWWLKVNGSLTTINGTSGSAKCVEPLTGTNVKTVTCYLNGYAQTGTAQTYTFPTAFSTTPVLLESGGSCGTYNPTATATTLTLPANASMTAETCNVVAIGQ